MKDKLIRILLCVAGLAVLGWCIAVGVRRGREVRRLTILHVNDTHSHNEVERFGDYAGMGGALERAAYIDSVRRADGAENVLLLHAGDFSQGSTYFSEYKGKVEVQILNAAHYDAVVLGNHEFDNGIEALGDLLESVEAPVVVCNYDFSPFKAGKFIRPYVIVEKAGLKIGIIGVLCGRLKNMVAGDIGNRIPELDLVESVQKYADELRPRCDVVLLLSHIGYEEHNPGDITDPVLCAATRGIDLIVGGHSHTFLSEPVYVENLDGQPVPIVQTGWMGVSMGEFHLRYR